MGNIIVSPPNEAAIISGCRGTRIIIGKCSFQFWIFETCKRLGLELMTISVESRSAETAKGVRISLSSTAQIKILTGHGAKVDLDKVELAAQHFLGYSRDEIQHAVHRTMEGHQRQVIGTPHRGGAVQGPRVLLDARQGAGRPRLAEHGL